MPKQHSMEALLAAGWPDFTLFISSPLHATILHAPPVLTYEVFGGHQKTQWGFKQAREKKVIF